MTLARYLTCPEEVCTEADPPLISFNLQIKTKILLPARCRNVVSELRRNWRWLMSEDSISDWSICLSSYAEFQWTERLSTGHAHMNTSRPTADNVFLRTESHCSTQMFLLMRSSGAQAVKPNIQPPAFPFSAPARQHQPLITVPAAADMEVVGCRGGSSSSWVEMCEFAWTVPAAHNKRVIKAVRISSFPRMPHEWDVKTQR